jgi:hypothetical protein
LQEEAPVEILAHEGWVDSDVKRNLRFAGCPGSAARRSPSWLHASPARPVNTARFVFLDPRAETFYDDWERVAGECVAILRWAAGRDPHDRDLSDLVGELATQSEAFRTRWAAHDVRFHNTGVKLDPAESARATQSA